MKALKKMAEHYDQAVLSVESTLLSISRSGSMTKDEKNVFSAAINDIKSNLVSIFSLAGSIHNEMTDNILKMKESLEAAEGASVEFGEKAHKNSLKAKELKKELDAVKSELSQTKADLKAMKARNNVLQEIIDKNQRIFHGSDEQEDSGSRS